MNVLLPELPAWAQSLLTWLLTGSNILTVLGVIAALFKINTNSKESKSVTTTQIGLLTTMTDKLADTRQLAGTVQTVSNQVSEALTFFEKALTQQRQSNAALATFVMECFNRSNLSDEAKTELQVMANKIFYDDNSAVIDALKQAKAEADSAVAAGLEQIARLEAELEAEKAKLVTAQENTKASRRV